MTHTNPASSFPKVTGESRQLLFLALCSLALVIAAFAAPPTAQGTSPPDIPDLFGNESEKTGQCTVALSEEPVPGREVTVNVRRAGTPVEDVRVWFNGRSIGVTDQSGQVEGTVPYVQTLEVAVSLPGGGSCEFVTGTTGTSRDRSSTDVGARNEQAGLLGAGTVPATAPRPAAQSTDGENATGTYTVRSLIDVGVVGEPNPGETVTLTATIEGDPVPAATVFVGGDEVGTTDENGNYTLGIPDDGTSTLDVRVRRGEISGRQRIDVRLLRASIQGENRFPLPGQSATVRAAIGTDAVEDAEVTLDGESIGTTNALGQAEFVLPADPTATVTVTTGDRTTRTTLFPVFAPTIVSVVGLFVFVVGIPLAVYWAGGRKAIAGLFGLAANLVTGAAGYSLAGRDGALFAVGSTALLIALVLFLRRPRLASEAGESTGRFLDSCVQRVTGGVLWFTRGVEVLIDQTRSSLDGTLDHLRSFEPVALAAGVRAWFVGLPGAFLAGLLFVVGVPRRLFEWFRSEPAADEADLVDSEPEPTPTVSAPGSTIRELWRTFARRVVPRRWPQRTPGEVSRRAIDAGFPRDSVVELTSVFRDVEYGGESVSNTHYERARTAFDELDGDDESTDDGTGDGEVTE